MSTGGGSTPLWREPTFYWPATFGPILAGIVVAVFTVLFTGGFSSLTSQEEHGVTISAERTRPAPTPTISELELNPSVDESPANEEQQLNPSPSASIPPNMGNSGKARSQGQGNMAVVRAGSDNGDQCSVDEWVYFRSPADCGRPGPGARWVRRVIKRRISARLQWMSWEDPFLLPPRPALGPAEW